MAELLHPRPNRPLRDLAASAAFNFLHEMPLPVFILNRDQGLYLANPALARTFGYDDVGIVQERLKSVEFLSAHFKARDVAALYEALGQNVHLRNWLLIGQDLQGRDLTVEINARARLRTPQGPADFMEAFFSFPGLATEADPFLQEARKEAELASKAKNEFLSNISHELRTPLNIIIGMLEISLDDPGTADDLRENLAVAKDTADNLYVTLNDLIVLSNLEGRRLTSDISQFSPNLLLKALGNQFQAKARNKGISLSLVNDQAGDTVLDGGYNLIIMALEKLLDNAIKFSEENSQVILEAGLVTEGDGPWLHCRVLDSGPGFNELILESVEIFRQGDGSMNRKYGGLGLGLQLARSLAATLGGGLTMANRPEGGADLRLKVPVEYSQVEV